MRQPRLLILLADHRADFIADFVEKEADLEEKLRDGVQKSNLLVIRLGMPVGLRDV